MLEVPAFYICRDFSLTIQNWYQFRKLSPCWGLAWVVPAFMLPVWAPMPCPPHFSQTPLKLPGETVTGYYFPLTGLTLCAKISFKQKKKNSQHASSSFLVNTPPTLKSICLLLTCFWCVPGKMYIQALQGSYMYWGEVPQACSCICMCAALVKVVSIQ